MTEPTKASGAQPKSGFNIPGFAQLQRLGKSLMLPIALLPAAGILLRLGQPDLLGGIKAPATILFVTPAGVPMTDAQMTKVYEDAYAPLKGAKVKHIANSAHFIMWDQPAAFQAEVKAFLK